MRAFAALVLLVILGAPARADVFHWRFEDLRVASPCGRWSAIVTREGRERKVRVEIYERRAVGDTRRDASCAWRRWDRILQPRETDRLVGCCEVATVPRYVYMTHSPTRLVFVDSERYGRGRLVTMIDPRGHELATYDMRSLFAGRKRTFGESTSRTWWSDWHFFSHGRLVLVVNRGHGRGDPLDYTYSSSEDTEPYELVAVSLADGSLVAPDPRWVLPHALDRRSIHRGAALTIARRYRIAEALPIAERIAFDTTQALDARLHAADTATALGSTRSVKRLFLAAAQTSGHRAQTYAIRRLGCVVGEAAAPVLRTILEQDGHLWDVGAALDSIGPALAPTMIEWLDDPEADPDVRMVAAVRLGAWKSRDAIEPLYRAVHHGPASLAGRAARSLGTIGPPDLVDRFCRVLRAGGPGVEGVANHFRVHPTERARDALDAALRRMRDGSESMVRFSVEDALDTLDVLATIRRCLMLRPH